MKKKYTIPAGAAALLVGLTALTGCSSAGTSGGGEPVADDCKPIVEGVKMVKDGVLTTAVAEYPPYVSQAGGELSGVDGELQKRIAEELCLTIDAQTQSFTAIIESVKAGSVDLSSGNWYVDDERREQFEVSDPVYKDQMSVVSIDGAKSLADLEGKKIATVQGYLWVGDFQKALGTDNVQLYATEDAAYQDIKNGRVDAGIFTVGAARQLLETNNDSERKVETFESDPAIGASVDEPQSVVLIEKGNTKLQEAVNAVLAKMREDGSMAKALEDNGFDPTAADVNLDN